MNLNALKEPFPAGDIEWRVQASGKKGDKIWARCVAYVTNRAIMNRLDDVCGAAHWRNEYAPAPAGGIMCGISIRIGDEWITKWDGAENTDIEAVKGGMSGAMKRAAVQWGIGRYLYLLDAGWANVHANGEHSGRLKKEDGGTWFKWDPPALPSWALPGAKLPDEPEKRKADPEPEPREPAPLVTLPKGERCTHGQATLIERMVRSHVITDDEREPILARVAAGALSKERATDCIDWLKKTLDERKSAEKAVDIMDAALKETGRRTNEPSMTKDEADEADQREMLAS